MARLPEVAALHGQRGRAALGAASNASPSRRRAWALAAPDWRRHVFAVQARDSFIGDPPGGFSGVVTNSRCASGGERSPTSEIADMIAGGA
jgi:hypothetical protein